MKTKNLYKGASLLFLAFISLVSCSRVTPPSQRVPVVLKGVIKSCPMPTLEDNKGGMVEPCAYIPRCFGFISSEGKEYLLIKDNWSTLIDDYSFDHNDGWSKRLEKEPEESQRAKLPFVYNFRGKKIFSEDTIILRASSGYIKDFRDKRHPVVQVESIERIPSKDFIGSIIIKEFGQKSYLCLQDGEQTFYLLNSKGEFIESKDKYDRSEDFVKILEVREGLTIVIFGREYINKKLVLNEKYHFMAYPKGNKKLNGKDVSTVYLTGLYNNQFFPSEKWKDRL